MLKQLNQHLSDTKTPLWREDLFIAGLDIISFILVYPTNW